jgi:hypothetical protein
LKNLQKPLDNSLPLWYNKGTKGEGRNGRTEAHESDVRRNPTKTPTARCVGVRYTNVNQSRLAEEMTDYAYYKAKKNSKYPLTKRSRCGIMNVQGEGRTTSPSRKKSQEKVEKTS